MISNLSAYLASLDPVLDTALRGMCEAEKRIRPAKGI